jgi:AcrR family transcriptional regulator
LGGPNVREKLSGSAAALFQRFGYVHVSIRDITSSIDVPKGTFALDRVLGPSDRGDP